MIIFKKLFIILFILVITTTLFIPAKFALAQDLEDELDLIRKEKERTQERLDEIKKEEAEYFKQVKEVEENLILSLSELPSVPDADTAARHGIEFIKRL